MAMSTVSGLSTTDPAKVEVDKYFEPFQSDVLVVWADIRKRFPSLAKIGQDFFLSAQALRHLRLSSRRPGRSLILGLIHLVISQCKQVFA